MFKIKYLLRLVKVRLWTVLTQILFCVCTYRIRSISRREFVLPSCSYADERNVCVTIGLLLNSEIPNSNMVAVVAPISESTLEYA